MDELKPCPFCGGEAILGWDYKEEVYFIHCKKCRCTIYNGNEIRDEKAGYSWEDMERMVTDYIEECCEEAVAEALAERSEGE